nr:hypothetical protein [Sedimentibacter sp.]
MEQKTLISNDFVKLLIHSLKQKRNWFFISTVIIFVTTLLIPYILKFSEEFFILVGIVEIFIIVFINCLIDNSFLHNDSKLGYYKSKPVSLTKQISVIIVTNIALSFFLIILLSISIGFHHASYEYYEVLKFLVPWLVAGIFLTSLSSILTGNTIMAGVMTIFNFSLPALFYLIILFVFTILEDIVIGFNANILMNTLTNTFYKLDYLYFFEYLNKPIDIIYVTILASIIVILSLIIVVCLKRRENENTGDFIVFDGFKYFVSVLASIIIPATFSMLLYEVGVTSKIIVSLLLSALTYYIIIAVLEKSFRISIFSIKLFAGCMTIFIALTGGTIIFAQQYKDYIPDTEDVKAAYIGNNSWFFSDYMNNKEKYGIENYEKLLDRARDSHVTIFIDKNSIEYITELHREMLTNQNYLNSYYYRSNVVISYLMNDGSVIIRDYKLNGNNVGSEKENKIKDEIANKILNSNELKKERYFYLYDEDYYKGKEIHYNLRRFNSSDIEINDLDINNIRLYLIKDIENMSLSKENAFEYLIFQGDFYQYPKEENGFDNYYIEIVEEGIDGANKIIDEVSLNSDFKNTREFLHLNN